MRSSRDGDSDVVCSGGFCAVVGTSGLVKLWNLDKRACVGTLATALSEAGAGTASPGSGAGFGGGFGALDAQTEERKLTCIAVLREGEHAVVCVGASTGQAFVWTE